MDVLLCELSFGLQSCTEDGMLRIAANWGALWEARDGGPPKKSRHLCLDKKGRQNSNDNMYTCAKCIFVQNVHHERDRICEEKNNHSCFLEGYMYIIQPVHLCLELKRSMESR